MEDNADIRHLIAVTLELNDYEIQEATQGEQGWELASHWQPDLAIVDVMLPGSLDGLELCRRIKSDPDIGGCVVIMLTALGMQRDVAAGTEAGANAYLIKPFSPLHLLATLETWLPGPA